MTQPHFSHAPVVFEWIVRRVAGVLLCVRSDEGQWADMEPLVCVHLVRGPRCDQWIRIQHGGRLYTDTYWNVISNTDQSLTDTQPPLRSGESGRGNRLFFVPW